MNYVELVDAAKAYADRQDAEVSDNIGIFFFMAEARINRLLKTREQSTREYIATEDGEEYYDLPDDYAGMRNIQLDSDLPPSDHSVTPFSYLQPEAMDHIRQREYGGILYYTVIANKIQVYPCISEGNYIELVYYQKVPPLSNNNKNNWISDHHPDIYLSGLCAEISVFVKDYVIGEAWDARMTRAIEELDMSDETERWSGSQLMIRTV